MFFFSTRQLARNWAAKAGYKFVDKGADSPANQRWGVKVLGR